MMRELLLLAPFGEQFPMGAEDVQVRLQLLRAINEASHRPAVLEHIDPAGITAPASDRPRGKGRRRCEEQSKPKSQHAAKVRGDAYPRKNCPVRLSAVRATCSGVPWATIWPPSSPAS